MSDRRRVAVMFDLDRADAATGEIVRGIHQYAHGQGGRWVPVLDPLALEHLDGRYDGLLAPGSRTAAARTRAAGLPCVLTTCKAINPAVARMLPNRRRAGTMAARHLMAQNYTQFGFLGYHADTPSRLLETGFREGLWQRGQVADYLLVSAHYRSGPRCREGQLKVFGDWLERLEGPVGILVACAAKARYVAQLCAERGLRVPDDVGIVAAGDEAAVCQAPPVALTAIEFRFATVGRRAASYLDRLMDGKPRLKGNAYVEPGLVARASTEREFFHDDAVAKAVALIHERCCGRLTVGEVAAAVGLGERQLLRRFRSSRHHTVAREIGLARLARAKDLMRTTRLPLDAVARGSGFRDARHLARAFRRVEHCAPGAWRRASAERPPRDVHPLEHAKRLLERTDYDLGCIAVLAGLRSVYRLRKAFLEQEHMLPTQWRRRFRKPRPKPAKPTAPPRVRVTFIGPTGEVEEVW